MNRGILGGLFCFFICLLAGWFFFHGNMITRDNIATNGFVLSVGILVAVILTLGWKIGGGLRQFVIGKSDVIDDEVRIFNFRKSFTIGLALALFFLVISAGAFYSDDPSIIRYNLNPFLFPLGFIVYFPLLFLQNRMIEKIRKESAN